MAAKITKWNKIFTDWKASGLTRSEYCRTNNIPLSTFDYWRQRVRKEGEIACPEKLVKLPVSVQKPSEPFSIVFPNKLRLQIPSSYREEELKKLIKELIQCC